MNYKNFAKFGQNRENLAYIAMVISNNRREIVWTERTNYLLYRDNDLKMISHYRKDKVVKVQSDFYNFGIYETKNNR